jgi:hypothetical protein
MGGTGAGDVSEDPFAVFHDGEPGESGGIDVGRPGELGGASDGDGFVGVFSHEQEDREFVVAECVG